MSKVSAPINSSAGQTQPNIINKKPESQSTAINTLLDKLNKNDKNHDHKIYASRLSKDDDSGLSSLEISSFKLLAGSDGKYGTADDIVEIKNETASGMGVPALTMTVSEFEKVSGKFKTGQTGGGIAAFGMALVLNSSLNAEEAQDELETAVENFTEGTITDTDPLADKPKPSK